MTQTTTFKSIPSMLSQHIQFCRSHVSGC